METQQPRYTHDPFAVNATIPSPPGNLNLDEA